MSKETDIYYDDDGMGYLFEQGAGSLSLQEKERLGKLFWAIADVVKKYKSPLNQPDAKKLSPKILAALIETRKNVDDAVLQAIQANPQVLFIKVFSCKKNVYYYPLWELIGGKEYLPKTMEFIMKHPTARFVTSHLGKIIPWEDPMCRTPYILNIAAEIPEYRTALSRGGDNLGMYIASDILGESENRRAIPEERAIELLSKFLDYADCSTQQTIYGHNIGHYCIFSARRALKRYYETCKKIEEELKFTKSSCDSLRGHILRYQQNQSKSELLKEMQKEMQEKLEANEQYMKQRRSTSYKEYDLARKLQALAEKSMILYPETAHQEVQGVGSLKEIYTKLCIELESCPVEDREKLEAKGENQFEEDLYKALIASPEDLARQLSIKIR